MTLERSGEHGEELVNLFEVIHVHLITVKPHTATNSTLQPPCCKTSTQFSTGFQLLPNYST